MGHKYTVTLHNLAFFEKKMNNLFAYMQNFFYLCTAN